MSKNIFQQLSTDFKVEVAIQSLLMAAACDLSLGSPPEYMFDMQVSLLMGAAIDQ